MLARLLIVDDMDLILQFTGDVLKGAGYDVYATADIPQAISAFRDFAPDLCVLDYHMPQMLGSELARRFNKIDSSVEIIFLTAEDEASLAIEMMKGGALDYLIKPVDSNRLLASISRGLEHRRLVRENLDCKLHLEAMVARQTAALNASLRQLERLSTATLQTLGLALDFRDQSTSGHSQRVASNTTAIAREIGITGDRLLSIEQGAFLHDIGKFELSAAPGSFSFFAWTEIEPAAYFDSDFMNRYNLFGMPVSLKKGQHLSVDVRVQEQP